MPDRHVGARGEAQTEQPLRRVKRSLDHAVEGEIRLDGRLIDSAAPAAQLIGVIAPIPGRERKVAALLLHQRLQVVAVGERFSPRARPYRVQEIAHGFRRLRHRIVEPVMGEVGIAEQFCALGPQLHHFGDDRLVVGGAAIVAARDKSAKHLFAQVAPLRELQERFDARPRQRDDVAVEAAFLRFGSHRFAHETRQPGKLRFALKRQREILLIGQHVLAERGAERRQPLDDRGEARLRRRFEAGAGAAEGHVVTLEHAFLLGGQAERVGLPHEGFDAPEQRRVGVDFVPVAGDLRGDLPLDLEQRVIAVGADQKVEDVFDPRQRTAAQFEGADRIIEARRFRRRRDGRNLGLMLGERARVGRAEVLGRDAVERGNLVGGRPRLKEGIFR